MRLRLFCLLSLLYPLAAHAGEVVIYRCTDASGDLTLQNSPCPKGSREEKRVMQSVSTVPMSKPAAPSVPASAPSPAAADHPAAASPVSPAVETNRPTPTGRDTADARLRRLPPPYLFQCTTPDRDTYFSEDAEPPPRCVPLRTVGLDGNPQTGAGEACEMKRDQCARVGDTALCDAWKQRRDAAEVAWRFARPDNVDRNRTDFERVQRIVAESECGP